MANHYFNMWPPIHNTPQEQENWTFRENFMEEDGEQLSCVPQSMPQNVTQQVGHSSCDYTGLVKKIREMEAAAKIAMAQKEQEVKLIKDEIRETKNQLRDRSEELQSQKQATEQQECRRKDLMRQFHKANELLELSGRNIERYHQCLLQYEALRDGSREMQEHQKEAFRKLIAKAVSFNEQMNSTIKSSLENISASKADVDVLRVELERLNEYDQTLEGKIEHSARSAEQLQQEVDGLLSQLATTSTSCLQRKEVLHKALEWQQALAAKAKHLLAFLHQKEGIIQSRLSALQVHIENCSKKKQVLSEALHEKRRKVEANTCEYQALNATHVAITEEIEGLKNRLVEEEQKLAAIKADVSKKETENASSKMMVSETEKRNKGLESNMPGMLFLLDTSKTNCWNRLQLKKDQLTMMTKLSEEFEGSIQTGQEEVSSLVEKRVKLQEKLESKKKEKELAKEKDATAENELVSNLKAKTANASSGARKVLKGVRASDDLFNIALFDEESTETHNRGYSRGPNRVATKAYARRKTKSSNNFDWFNM